LLDEWNAAYQPTSPIERALLEQAVTALLAAPRLDEDPFVPPRPAANRVQVDSPAPAPVFPGGGWVGAGIVAGAGEAASGSTP